MLSAELQATFILLIIPEVLTFQCPDVVSCDCRQKQTSHEISNTVECHGDIQLNTLNSTDLQNSPITELILNNVTVDTNILDKNLFDGLNVNKIKIKSTRLKFEQDSFSLLKPSLRHLALFDVGIKFATSLDFLQGFSALETLELDKNGEFPVHFPSIVFANLSLDSLKKLSLRDCGIAKIEDSAFEGFPNVEILDLSYNKLPAIPGAILLLKNLRKLTLAHNSVLYYIHDQAFVSLNKLQRIDMSHTALHTIGLAAFYGLERSLRILQLNHGKLPYGPFSSLKNLQELRLLDISYNNIVEMHNTSFEGFQSLEELDISGQFDEANLEHSFTFVDSMFLGVESQLQVLRIRHLGLESLPLNALSRLRALRELDASENKFVEIYESFFDHISARTIKITDMGINEISKDAFDHLRGVNIIFDRNNITNISFIKDVAPCTFNKLSFIGNPISCDCDVVEIVFTNRVGDLVGTCANKAYRGQNLKHLDKSNKALDTCDTSKLEKIEYCKYTNAAPAVISLSIAIFKLLLLIFITMH